MQKLWGKLKLMDCQSKLSCAKKQLLSVSPKQKYMKLSYFLFVFYILLTAKSASQVTIFTEAPVYDNSTSTGRGPNGTSAHVFMRACALVKPTELTGIVANSTLTTFGFTLNVGASINAPAGNFTVYLQNTANTTYNKGTSFTTAIVGMTQVFNGSMTLPLSAGTTSVTVTLTTPFVYTGGGLYVAYDWYNPGPYSGSAVVYRCNSGGLSPGCATNAGATVPAADVLGTTAFRPCFLFGVANTFTNEIAVTGINTNGRLSGMIGTTNTITAFVRNNSNQTRSNIPVTLSISGANIYSATQAITSLAAGASTTVLFTSFLPAVSGLNTLSVSVPSDQENNNNSATYSQSITCNEWALNPATGSYTSAVGFNTGSGIIAVNYQSPVTSTLTGLRGSVSTNTPSVGNNSWGVLLNASGAILATTNTITITNADLGSFVTYSFATPPVLSPSTQYYFGFAQPSNISLGYFPLGGYINSTVPYLNYVTTTTVGGTPAPLTSNLGYFGIEAIFTPTLALSVSPPATIVCGNQAVLSVTTADSYTWAAGPVNANYSVSPITSSVYSVNAMSAFGCAASKTIAVLVNPITLSVTQNPPSGTICAGFAMILVASGADSYSWNTTPPITQNIMVDVPVTSFTYVVTGLNMNGCSNTASVNAIVNPTPNISLSSQTVICGTQATLVALTADSYTWNNGTANNNLLVTPTVNTTYSVIAVNSFSCSATRTVNVIVSPLALTVTASTPSVCSGGSVGLSATGANTYTWLTQPAVISPGMTVNPQAQTVYSVQGINQAGCSASGIAGISVIPNPVISFSPSTVICGTTTTLTVSSDASYTWAAGPANTDLIIVSPTVSANYSVTATNIDNCTSNAVVPLSIAPFTVTAVPSATAVCEGNSVTLTAGGAYSYTWTAPGFSSTGVLTTAAPTITTIYSLMAAGVIPACTDTETLVVFVNPQPNVMITLPADAICVGQSATLTVSGASSYQWNDGSSGNQLVITPTLATSLDYSVTGTNANSCTGPASISVIVSACTGLDENERTFGGIRVYPNPFKNSVTVAFETESSTRELKVVNALGQEIMRLEGVGEETILNLGSQTNGIYFIFLIENDRPLRTIKVVKE